MDWNSHLSLDDQEGVEDEAHPLPVINLPLFNVLSHFRVQVEFFHSSAVLGAVGTGRRSVHLSPRGMKVR